MVRKLALQFTLYSGGFLMILLLLYVAASGPVLHRMAVKNPNSTLMPWRFSHPGAPLFPPLPLLRPQALEHLPEILTSQSPPLPSFRIPKISTLRFSTQWRKRPCKLR
jgi:hypothetical protein